MRCLQIIILISVSAPAQEPSIKYECLLHTGQKTRLLYESLELKPDSTYSCMSEYDLAWEETGTYSIKDNTLTLNPLISNGFTIIDAEPKRFFLEDNNLFLLDKAGKKIKRIHDRSVGGFSNWLRGYNFKYYYKKVRKFLFRDN